MTQEFRSLIVALFRADSHRTGIFGISMGCHGALTIELLNPDGVTPVISAKKLSKYCNVLLKGGHSKTDIAEDVLFENDNRYVFSQDKINGGEKHGSGCVLSAAVTANLAKGYTLVESSRKAKNYTTGFLSCNVGLLGYHYR